MKILISILFTIIFIGGASASVGDLPIASNNDKTIYLTFDDGPIDITKNIVDVLKNNNIKATFFVNGMHMFGNGGESETNAVDSLVYAFKNGEVIANHSYDHMLIYHICNPEKIPGGTTGAFYSKFCAHDYVVSAYFNPAVEYALFDPLNTSGIRDVIYDSDYRISGKRLNSDGLYGNDELNTLARLPYTNSWRVHIPGGGKIDVSMNVSSQSNKNASLLADKLALHGYDVYGWDLEWGPTNWSNRYPSDTLASLEQLKEQTISAFKSCDVKRADSCDPRVYSYAIHKNKVIILTHDFLFENSDRGNGSTNLVVLNQFIKDMKAKGYKFDTLDHYVK